MKGGAKLGERLRRRIASRSLVVREYHVAHAAGATILRRRRLRRRRLRRRHFEREGRNLLGEPASINRRDGALMAAQRERVLFLSRD